MDYNIRSISSDSNNVRQEEFSFGQWTIKTRKGIILQSKCTCENLSERCKTTDSIVVQPDIQQDSNDGEDSDKQNNRLCQICWYFKSLPQLNNMPDMLFKDNILKLEHYTGVGIEFNPLDALKLVKETKDPLRVAVAGGWQSARSDFPFAKKIVKPYDWTLTTDYRGTLLSAIKKKQNARPQQQVRSSNNDISMTTNQQTTTSAQSTVMESKSSEQGTKDFNNESNSDADKLCFEVEETDERIDVNKLKVKEEILFYDDVTLYEDELADHGTAQYSVKVRVMPKSLFILARYYLRVDGVLARINDTRVYYELNKRYLLREYTNREAKLSSLPPLPVSILVNPNELMNHLPIVENKYEKLSLPKLTR